MSRVLLPDGHCGLIEAVLESGDIPIVGLLNTTGVSFRQTALSSKYPEVEIFTMPQFDTLCLGAGHRIVSFPVPIENVTKAQLRRVLRGY